MSIRITCPECDRPLNVSEESLGKRVKCPGCSATFTAEEAPREVKPMGVTEEENLERIPKSATKPAPRDEDDKEEAPRRRPRRRREDDEGYADEGVGTLIPYRNPKALAAYYCGVFGLIPCLGLILGPIALIFGILGLKAVRAKPRMHGTGHAIAGIVLGSLELLGHLIVGVLIAIGIATAK
jgi:predicted Zn finger-like uncharacterized protein